MIQALLVIDFIKGIVETGSCASVFKENPSLLSNVNQLIQSFREKKQPVIHIRLAFDETYAGLPKHAPSRPWVVENQKFLLNHPDTEFISAIAKQEGDFVLNKKYGDPFYQSGLLDLLNEQGCEEVVLTGVSTDNAILYGANSAILNGFSTCIITDCIGAPTRMAHEHALEIMKGRVVNRFMAAEEFLAL